MAIAGVMVSKYVVARMSKKLFTALEYILMTGASVRLIVSGLSSG